LHPTADTGRSAIPLIPNAASQQGIAAAVEYAIG
jgi:hypothetical protein